MNSFAFIDGAQLRRYTLHLGWSLDYAKLLTYLQESSTFVRPYYYNLIPADKQVHSPVISLSDWLSQNGYVTRLSHYHDHDLGNRIQRTGEYSSRLIVDAMSLTSHTSTMIFVGVDYYHVPLFAHLRREGIRVVVVGCASSEKHVLPPLLRKHIDVVVDLDSLRDKLENHHVVAIKDDNEQSGADE